MQVGLTKTKLKPTELAVLKPGQIPLEVVSDRILEPFRAFGGQ